MPRALGVTESAVGHDRQTQHVPDAFLHAYAAGELSAVERGAVERHVATCEVCRGSQARIERTVALFGAAPAAPSELAWRRIEKRVAEQLTVDAQRRVASRGPSRVRPGARVAVAIASLAAAMAIGLWLGLRIDRAPSSVGRDVAGIAPATNVDGARETERLSPTAEVAPRESAKPGSFEATGAERLEPRALVRAPTSSRAVAIVTPAHEPIARSDERALDYVGARATRGPERSTSFGQTHVEVEAPSDPLAALWLRTSRAYYESRDLPLALSLAQRIVDEGGDRPEVALAEEILCDGYIATRQAGSAVAACQVLLRRAEMAGLEERARAIHYQIGTIHRVELGDCAAAMYHYGRSVVFGRTSILDDEALMWRVDCAIQLGDENSARRDLALLQRSGSRPGRRERLEALAARFEQMVETGTQPGERPRGRAQPVDDTR